MWANLPFKTGDEIPYLRQVSRHWSYANSKQPAVEVYCCEKVLRVFFVTVDTDNSSLKTSLEEWHDISLHCPRRKVISIKTLDDFFEQDIAMIKD